MPGRDRPESAAPGKRAATVPADPRGLAPAAVGGLSTLVTTTSRAEVPPRLFATTITAASRLAAGGALAGTVPASVALLVNSMRRTMLMTKLMMTAGASVTIGVLSMVGLVLAQPGQVPAPPPLGDAKALRSRMSLRRSKAIDFG